MFVGVANHCWVLPCIGGHCHKCPGGVCMGGGVFGGAFPRIPDSVFVDEAAR